MSQLRIVPHEKPRVLCLFVHLSVFSDELNAGVFLMQSQRSGIGPSESSLRSLGYARRLPMPSFASAAAGGPHLLRSGSAYKMYQVEETISIFFTKEFCPAIFSQRARTCSFLSPLSHPRGNMPLLEGIAGWTRRTTSPETDVRQSPSHVKHSTTIPKIQDREYQLLANKQGHGKAEKTQWGKGEVFLILEEPFSGLGMQCPLCRWVSSFPRRSVSHGTLGRVKIVSILEKGSPLTSLLDVPIFLFCSDFHWISLCLLVPG